MEIMVKKIKATNFKSFKEIDVNLDKLNVLIGANASGKSNFVEIFKFLRDIANHGLNNAISMQGGIEHLRNINSNNDSNNLSLKIVFEPKFEYETKIIVNETEESMTTVEPYEITYEFELMFDKKDLEFEIVKDKITQKCKITDIKKHENDNKSDKYNGDNDNNDKTDNEKHEIGTGEIIISCVKGNVNIDLNMPENISMNVDDIFPPSFLRKKNIPSNELLLETVFSIIPFPLRFIFSDISVYYIDPKLPKKATPITGKAELEEDGSNLAIILKNIIENEDEKRKLFNLVRDILPFVDDLDVEKFADKSLLFKICETYSEKQYLPASLISDGTINITALIIALYFEEKPMIIIEEPERNIHPYLISKIVDMMKEVSNKKQIIITTHHPEVVKYADLKNILLVSRDEKGFSTISKPVEKEEVKIFLENEIGIDELYVQNLL
jgi:predicted ATPase